VASPIDYMVDSSSESTEDMRRLLFVTDASPSTVCSRIHQRFVTFVMVLLLIQLVMGADYPRAVFSKLFYVEKHIKLSFHIRKNSYV
jgi:hypothetical protein